MRIGENNIKNEIAMFMSNYAVCVALSLMFMDNFNNIFGTEKQFITLAFGVVTGILYLGSFVFLKYNMKCNGIVLAATFMKLGVLIPTIMAIVVFGEIPTFLQIGGIAIAFVAIIIIHFEEEEGEKSHVNKKIWLVILLVLGGLGDSMANIFDKVGHVSGKDGFLLMTFVTAFFITFAIVLKGLASGYSKIHKEDILYGLIIGIPNYLSCRFLLLAVGVLDAVIVYPTYSVATMVVIAIAGVVIFREKISKRKCIALCLIAVAIALLNL